MSILCIITLIILVGLDDDMLSHLMGSFCDGVTTYNIGIWLSVKYHYRSHEPIVYIF